MVINVGGSSSALRRIQPDQMQLRELEPQGSRTRRCVDLGARPFCDWTKHSKLEPVQFCFTPFTQGQEVDPPPKSGQSGLLSQMPERF